MTNANFGPTSGPVAIPLGNAPGEFALFDPADWAAWQAAGMPERLFLNRATPQHSYVAYVDKTAPGELAYVARWIMQPGRDQCVRFNTRNRLDLRRSNLRLMKRKAVTSRSNAAAARKGTTRQL